MKRLITLFVLLLLFASTHAQNQATFKSIGKKQKVYTLSNDRFDESFINDTIQQIGSVRINTVTGHITKLLTAGNIGSAEEDLIVGSRFLSVDPLTFKFPSITPYNISNNNPLFFIDETGAENIPALLWAYQNLIGVPWLRNSDNESVSYYVGDKKAHFGHSFVAGKRPDYGVCFDLTWTSYLNSSKAINNYLTNSFVSNTKAFTDKNQAFFGRANARPWFMDNKEGRKFETDINKGQLGDLIFMGEDNDMHGHSVMVAEAPILDKNALGNETITFKTLSTNANRDNNGNDVFGERDFTFMKDKKTGKWVWTSQVQSDGTVTKYEFKGFGQLDSKITDPKQKYKGVSGIFRFLMERQKAKQNTEKQSSSTTTN